MKFRLGVVLSIAALPLFAQQPPAPAPAPAPVGEAAKTPRADDTPSFKVGALIFADYTYTQSPETRDADGNLVHNSSFNVTRAYINITGNLNHLIGFRITPDITRETGSGSSLSGSQEFRLKYAWAQFNLDDWLTKGSFARFGLQTTPLIDYEEQIYRYRFQGSTFTDREGFVNAADTGAAVRYFLPGNYGDVHAGVYNGETFTRAETNNEKSLQLRASLRPLPNAAVAKGLRLTGYVNTDHYVEHAARERYVGQVTFEHPRVNAGFDYLAARDQRSVAQREVKARGWSLWATPKLVRGWEALFRHDELKPDTASSTRRKRDIEGIAYWFAMPKGVASAVMLDRDSTATSGAPRVTNYGVKMLVSF